MSFQLTIPCKPGSLKRVVSPIPCPFCGREAKVINDPPRVSCNHDSTCLLRSNIVYDFQLWEWNRRWRASESACPPPDDIAQAGEEALCDPSIQEGCTVRGEPSQMKGKAFMTNKIGQWLVHWDDGSFDIVHHSFLKKIST